MKSIRNEIEIISIEPKYIPRLNITFTNMCEQFCSRSLVCFSLFKRRVPFGKINIHHVCL